MVSLSKLVVSKSLHLTEVFDVVTISVNCTVVLGEADYSTCCLTAFSYAMCMVKFYEDCRN